MTLAEMNTVKVGSTVYLIVGDKFKELIVSQILKDKKVSFLIEASNVYAPDEIEIEPWHAFYLNKGQALRHFKLIIEAQIQHYEEVLVKIGNEEFMCGLKEGL